MGRKAGGVEQGREESVTLMLADQREVEVVIRQEVARGRLEGLRGVSHPGHCFLGEDLLVGQAVTGCRPRQPGARHT